MRWIFLQQIDELVVGERIRGRACFRGDLPLFQDHFPGWPVVPGVLLLESMAQLAGKAIGYTMKVRRGYWAMPVLTMMDRVKFRRFVRPDDEIVLEADLITLREEAAVVRARARVAGRVVAQAEQTFVFNPEPLRDPEASARLERYEGEELARLWAEFDAQVWS